MAPELVLCSPATRTRETLDAIRVALGGPEVRFEERLYAASDDELLDALRGVDPGVGSVLVIAHNPGLEDLAPRSQRHGQEKSRPARSRRLRSTARGTSSRRACKLTGFVVPRELG